MNEILKEIKPLLVNISKKLGESAEVIWRALVKQQYIDGIKYLLGSFIHLSAILLVLWLNDKSFFISEKMILDSTIFYTARNFLMVIVICVSIVNFLQVFWKGIERLANAKYRALENLKYLIDFNS